MTMTTKEKRFANIYIEIPQHTRDAFKFLTESVAFFASSISVGRGNIKLQKERGATFIYDVLV